MPQKKSAKTLFELCIDSVISVIKEMDCMWRRKPIEEAQDFVVVDSEIAFTPFYEFR